MLQVTPLFLAAALLTSAIPLIVKEAYSHGVSGGFSIPQSGADSPFPYFSIYSVNSWMPWAFVAVLAFGVIVLWKNRARRKKV